MQTPAIWTAAYRAAAAARLKNASRAESSRSPTDRRAVSRRDERPRLPSAWSTSRRLRALEVVDVRSHGRLRVFVALHTDVAEHARAASQRAHLAVVQLAERALHVVAVL